MIYPFILYPRISDSIKNEYQTRGIIKAGDFSKQLGLAMPILALCGVIPVVGALAALANLVILIMYWVKMSEYKNELIKTRNLNNFSISNSQSILD